MADRETVPALKTRLKALDDTTALRAEFVAENDHADGQRPDALAALTRRAKELNVTEGEIAEWSEERSAPKPATIVAETTPGAQPATGEASAAQRESHEETVARLNKQAAGEEGNVAGVPDGKDFDARKELLKAFRQIEHIANQLNLRLPS